MNNTIPQADFAPDEPALLLRARDNDFSAFEQLYRIHIGRVFTLCVRLLGDRDMAEDMAQEAFVQAWKNLSHFRGDSAFGSWLYRITTNTVISYLRKNKAFQNTLDVDDIELVHRESQADRISLDTAIAALPEGARAVFVLYSVEGYTHSEIATLLGIAEGSSKAQLHRARQLLQQLLA